jgi:hypothetical protein
MPVDRDFTLSFIAGIKQCFRAAETRPEMQLVAVEAVTDVDAVILYRDRAGGPLLGRLYGLKDYAALFSDITPATLADEAWHGDLIDPSGSGEPWTVPWAGQVHPNPDEIRWIGKTDI